MRRGSVRAGQRLAGAAAVALVVVLTGCSADEQQASTELPPASSASAEPTPELPPLGPPDFPVPDEARTQDEAGAEAFLRYYIDLLNRQQAVPAGQPLRDLGPDCQQCAVIAQRFDEAANAGWKLQGGEVAIVGPPGVSYEGDQVKFSFIARSAAASAFTAAEGASVPNGSQPAQERIPSAMTLQWSEERTAWLATGLELG